MRELATAAERNTDSAAADTIEEATRHDADDEAKRHREEARSAARVGRTSQRSRAGGAEAQAADGGGAATGCMPSPRLTSKPSRSYPYAVHRMCAVKVPSAALFKFQFATPSPDDSLKTSDEFRS